MRVDARWRCAGCGRTVAASTVRLYPDGSPWGDCACGAAVDVLFERVAPHGTRDPADARVIGQDQSLLALPEVAKASFDDVIRRLPAGERFSVNTLRSRLDALEVPASARGGLFARAVRLGWARPLFVEAGGIRVAAREPSTGESAHLASVRVYERTTQP